MIGIRLFCCYFMAAIASSLVIAFSYWKNALLPTSSHVGCTVSAGKTHLTEHTTGREQTAARQSGNSTVSAEHSTFLALNKNDHVYKWFPGQPPIVVESHKLIFFDFPKVATTTWKKLFRRMHGYEDWKTANPHSTGGLVHLASLNRSYAEKIMNSPDYIRAAFVRDPKERFVSAWFDKAKAPGYLREHCCGNETDCPYIKSAHTSISSFVELAKICQDRHWNPYTVLSDKKWLSRIDFVGHYESLQIDARRLLEEIAAWDDYGASGWGPNGDESIFSSTADGHSTSQNKSDSWNRLSRILTPQTERALEEMYADDYNTADLQLPLQRVFDLGSCS